MATKVKKAPKAASKKVSAKAKPTIRKPSSSPKVRHVYYFGDGKADGDGKMKPLLGGKGANLHEMTRIGLPVPPGFTITTEVCTYFSENNKSYPTELNDQVEAALAKVEKSAGKKLGDRMQSVAAVCPFRCARFDARDDGHDSQPRDER